MNEIVFANALGQPRAMMVVSLYTYVTFVTVFDFGCCEMLAVMTISSSNL